MVQGKRASSRTARLGELPRLQQPVSTEAIRHVLDHFPYGGAKMLAMIALADCSKNRFDPFICSVSIADLAKRCRNSPRSMFNTLHELQQLGYLKPERESGLTA